MTGKRSGARGERGKARFRSGCRWRVSLPVGALLAALVGAGCLPAIPRESPRDERRVVEFGWDIPDLKFLRANIHRMEQLPFDGVVVNVGLHDRVFSRRPLPAMAIAEPLEDLRATAFRRFTDNFVLIWVVPGDLGWFEDWTPVIENVRLASRLARASGLRGILLDTEHYGSELFSYAQQQARDARSFGEYAARARLRGRDVGRAMGEEYPDLALLVTLAYHAAERDVPEDARRSDATYGLLPAFLDGVLEGMPASATLVDGFEFAYGFTREFEFARARWLIRHWLWRLSAVSDRYRARVQVGFGLWLDYQWRRRGWHPDDPAKNYFTPDAFAAALRLALRHSDRYVWVYTEKPNWWKGENLSPAYVEALSRARRPAGAR